MAQDHEDGMSTDLVSEITSKPIPDKKNTVPMRYVRSSSINALARHSIEAVETLVDVMRTGSNNERLRAAVRILEYTVGKPSEQEESQKVIREEQVTDVEFQELLDEDKEEDLQLLIEERYDKRRKTKTARI